MAFIRQRFKTDCGVAALAMLCAVTWEQALEAITWKKRRYNTTTKQLREAAILLGFKTESTPQNRLKLVTASVKWCDLLFTSDTWSQKCDLLLPSDTWSLIPANSLVKIPGWRSWHWVVWRKGKIYDPAKGVFTPEKYHEFFDDGRYPSSYMQFIEPKFHDPCPDCGAQLRVKSSSVECPRCDYRFCY